MRKVLLAERRRALVWVWRWESRLRSAGWCHGQWVMESAVGREGRRRSGRVLSLLLLRVALDEGSGWRRRWLLGVGSVGGGSKGGEEGSLPPRLALHLDAAELCVHGR